MNNLKNDREILLNSVIEYNNLQSLNNLFEMIKNLKYFSKRIIEVNCLAISHDELNTIKSVADGEIKCCTIDTIIELSAQCCELF